MTQPINIYQVFTRLFRNDNATNKKFGTLAENGCSKFAHFTDDALQAIKQFGITHVWFTGVIRHACTTDYTEFGLEKENPRIIKGRAGSPYAIKDYFDVAPDLAVNFFSRMSEFEAMIERTHNNGLKAIIDFVPNHVAREYKCKNLPGGYLELGGYDDKTKAFDVNNNFYYILNEGFHVPEGVSFPYTVGSPEYIEFPAKVTGNDAFTAHPSINDWYETIKLNYGIDYQNLWEEHFEKIPDTWVRMYEVLEFWTKKGVDGFRCDMAEMVPVEFWAWVIPQIKALNPAIIFVAEVYNPQEYKSYIQRGKFDYLYDKVGLYDILRLIIEGHGSAKYISDCWKMQAGVSDHMVRFLENHDEQRIASPYFGKHAFSAYASMILCATMNKGPLMIYFGQEIGEAGTDEEGYSGTGGRTTIFDYWSFTEYQKWVNKGAFDGALLSQKQRETRAFYEKLNKLRFQNPAITEGGFYDLMYVNYKGNLDADSIFAFFRFCNEQILLIVVNFDFNSNHDVYLKIPEHAMTLIGLPKDKMWKAEEIYNNFGAIEIDPVEALENGSHLKVPLNSACVFEIKKN
ncbi:MAG: alpha-amylase [Bacteroidales bacterium]|nr:alpha-amylase [Bacteroidales bacterium]